MFVLTQEKERKARRRGKALQNETSAPYAAEEEEMEGSGASGNEEEAPEDGEGTPVYFSRRFYFTSIYQLSGLSFWALWIFYSLK